MIFSPQKSQISNQGIVAGTKEWRMIPSICFSKSLFSLLETSTWPIILDTWSLFIFTVTLSTNWIDPQGKPILTVQLVVLLQTEMHCLCMTTPHLSHFTTLSYLARKWVWLGIRHTINRLRADGTHPVLSLECVIRKSMHLNLEQYESQNNSNSFQKEKQIYFCFMIFWDF